MIKKSLSLDRIRQILAILVQIGTLIIAYSAFSAVGYYKEDVQSGVVERTSNILAKLRPTGSVWDQLVDTYNYLKDPTKNETQKIEHIKSDLVFHGKLGAVLAFLEDMGLMYNENLIERRFVERGPSAAIRDYYDEVKFWIDLRRRESGNDRLFIEFEKMAIDLRRNS